MHSYLKAIGFSDITDKKKLDQILKEVIHTYDEKIVVEDGKHHCLQNCPKCSAVILGLQCVGNTMKIMNSKWNIIFRIFEAQALPCVSR